MTATQRELMWSIKKSLFRLSCEDIYQVSKHIAADQQDTVPVSPSNEEGCMDYIATYLQSQTLLELEDEGMS